VLAATGLLLGILVGGAVALGGLIGLVVSMVSEH